MPKALHRRKKMELRDGMIDLSSTDGGSWAQAKICLTLGLALGHSYPDPTPSRGEGLETHIANFRTWDIIYRQNCRNQGRFLLML